MVFDAGAGASWANIQIQNNQFTITATKFGILFNNNGFTWADGIFIGGNIVSNTQIVEIKPQSFNGSVAFPIAGNITDADVSIVSSMGVNFALASSASVVLTLNNTLANSVALLVVGGTVNTVGAVTGQYIVTGTSTVTTLQAIANVVVATNGTTITITNNTGQTFSGKALLNY